MKKATIYEKGNGFPSIGSLVYYANTNTVYRVAAWDGSDRISTNGPGVGNSVSVLLEWIGAGIDDDQREEIEGNNYGVVVED